VPAATAPSTLSAAHVLRDRGASVLGTRARGMEDAPRPPPRRDSTRVGGRAASPFGRFLSPRQVSGSGDYLPNLQAEAGTGVTPLPARRNSPRGASPGVGRALRQLPSIGEIAGGAGAELLKLNDPPSAARTLKTTGPKGRATP
jgi:hypothetical protein